MRTSNGKCSNQTTTRTPFIANNLFAEITSNGIYVVYSYGYHFPMYVYTLGTWYVNSDKYSVSTSKQQNQARPCTSQEPIKKTTEEIKKLYYFL